MTTTTDIKREALERAERVSTIAHDAYWKSLKDLDPAKSTAAFNAVLAAALLRARAEGIDWAAEQVDSDLVFGTLDELRTAANELERGE